ncbi:hypothetical protein RCIP0023_00435 [Klebsiella phage RCIP0023]
MNIKTTADKYWFIMNHPKFVNKNYIVPKIEIEPHNVCPQTNRIEQYEYLNTKVQYWIEFYIPVQEDGKWDIAHDYKHDCGGDTMDEAIDCLYNSVLNEYGNYTQEELDKKEDEVYNYNKSKVGGATMSYILSKIHEDLFEYVNDKILPDEEAECYNNNTVGYYENKIKELKGTLNSLIEFKRNAPKEMHKVIDKDIKNVEHDIFANEMSIKFMVDLDL